MEFKPQPHRLLAISLASLGALALAVGCSDGGSNPVSGTGGAKGTGGSMSGTGGRGTGGTPALGTGGTPAPGTGGARGTGGTPADGGPGTGGAIDAGGDTGVRGTGGAADAGGDTGVRGTGGARGTGGTSGDASTTDGGGTITLTSMAFTDGMRFPAANTCTGGSHMSPELAWTAGPSGTMSYAITLTDMTNGFVHWVIWDIPAATMELAANLAKTATLTTPAGARQVNRFNSNGYYGPCPMGTDHTYVFEVHALDVAMLSLGNNVPTTMGGVTMVLNQIQMHELAHGNLSGVSNASM